MSDDRLPPNQIHIHPTAELAERVLLPGDPGRAMRLAQELLDEPKMFNHNRGLWGYSGIAQDGGALTIQSSGIGGPSAAIVISELADLGATTFLRVGTCGTLDSTLTLGESVVVADTLCDDGTSRALSGCEVLASVSASLFAAGACAAGGSTTAAAQARAVTAVSTDLFYDTSDQRERWRAAGAQVVEMESATLFTLAQIRGVRAGCVLLVSDLLVDGRKRISAEALAAGELELGELALTLLQASSNSD